MDGECVHWHGHLGRVRRLRGAKRRWGSSPGMAAALGECRDARERGGTVLGDCGDDNAVATATAMAHGARGCPLVLLLFRCLFSSISWTRRGQ